MMKAADRDCVLVANLAVKRARLRKADVVRFGRGAAADDAWLRGDEFAVLLVAQTNGLRGNATAPNVLSLPERGRRLPRDRRGLGFALAGVPRRLSLPTASDVQEPSLSFLDRGEPLPEASFNSFDIGGRQGVLSREVLLNPVGGLVG